MSRRTRDRFSTVHEQRLYSLTTFMLINIWAGLFLFAALHGLWMG